jgi:hypothetical protein
MGHKVDFLCRACRYEERDLGVGCGRRPEPCLRLFHCDNCHSIGSTWVGAGKIARCSLCYDDAIAPLDDDVVAVDCPKCGGPGVFVHHHDEVWE